MLGWLVKAGLLEVRVGVLRHGVGLLHGKFGIITDAAGDAVVFAGSGNESAQALAANYERLEVSTSWDDPERHREYAGEFEALWLDEHPDVHTVALPEAVRLKLIRFAPKEPPVDEPVGALERQKAAMIWQFIAEAAYLPEGGSACDATMFVDLWPHQRRVIEDVTAAWPDGRLLCDEVGMGKTLEAIGVLRRLLAGRGVRRALLLVPAGLLRQWQDELREKGGLVIPRFEDGYLVWPGDKRQRVPDLTEALRQDVLLLSRETARTERNRALLLQAEPWDLVLLDEAHAARRAKQVESEYNSANLLLQLLRDLQLRGQARGFLLLSATPMQTHPWEPWDLLAVLGEGGVWLAEFSAVREYYRTIASLARGSCDLTQAQRAAEIIAADPDFPLERCLPGVRRNDISQVAQALAFTPPSKRVEVAGCLRAASPLARRMHRNTRRTLREYHRLGLIDRPPPRRVVRDERFDYQDPRERRVYEAITRYIDARFASLEREKTGKGFVMTVYRRRASSSPHALRCSLERRREGLLAVIRQRAASHALSREDQPELLLDEDLPDEVETEKVSAALPTDPQQARAELREVEDLLRQLEELGATDSKRDAFFGLLREVTDDGRPALVFTEYADTLRYLRESLVDHYRQRLGCYSGAGGAIWDGRKWKSVTKDVITRKLQAGELSVLICTDAASEGLNLQAAGALINYDLPWNPSRVEQRIGRIDRIGQRYDPIVIINLFLRDSVDERVYRVLRRRCHLFEHFVGPMQPVLAAARRMLAGTEPADPARLEREAQERQRDELLAETYLESECRRPPEQEPVLTREELIAALRELDGSFGIKVRCARDGGRLTLSGLGKSRKFGLALEALEAFSTLKPLSPFDSWIRKLSEQLSRTGERLPLVLDSYQQGAFRASVAFWIGGPQRVQVHSLRQLRRLMQAWDGTLPDPKRWQHERDHARREAAERVRQMARLAHDRHATALRRQAEAARRRLLLELGRYLVAAGADPNDLNAALYRHISRTTAGARRIHRCYECLGGYPDWPEPLRESLIEFVTRLSDNERQARQLGSELEAALADPRWPTRCAGPTPPSPPVTP